MHRRRIRAGSVALGVVLGCGVLVVTAGTGNAAPTQFTYETSGTTHLTGLAADLPLGPGRTDVQIDLRSGDLTAQIDLPESRVEFDLFGFLPTHADVQVTQAGELSGSMQAGTVNVSGDFHVQITELGHFGFGIPFAECQTTEPTRIRLTSEGEFNPAEGGTLTGTYELPEFEGCGFDTPIVNALVVGKENTISIDLAFDR
jgi:hypothetical protein